MEKILRRSKDAILGRRKPTKPATDGRCKKHPKHRQSPGVCSLCLSDKLSQINHTNPSLFSRRTSTTTGSGSSTTSSLSSYYSSEDDEDDDEEEESECSSPMQYCRNRYEGKKTASFLLLKKSRSLVFVSRNKEVRCSSSSSSNSTTTITTRDQERRSSSSSGGGFWSKLINPKLYNNNHHHNKRLGSSHRDQEPKFMHSRTVVDRSVLHQMVY